jgi:hypothetical protein
MDQRACRVGRAVGRPAGQRSRAQGLNEEFLHVGLRAVQDGEARAVPVEGQCQVGSGQQHRLGSLLIDQRPAGVEEAATLLPGARRGGGDPDVGIVDLVQGR